MQIVGAGMAGLLAAGMIRDRNVQVIEAASALPNNHSAVLRFRSSIVGDALDIQFKQVNMMKAVHEWRNPVADSLAYSMKCNGSATLRSIMSAGSEIHKRYIAPSDLIQQMHNRINGSIEFGKPLTIDDVISAKEPIISTVPMPLMMGILGWKDKPEFRFVNGFNVNCILENVDAYVSVYVPDPLELFNRVSLTGNVMTIEVSLPSFSSADEVSTYMNRIRDNDRERRDLLKSALYVLGIDKTIISNERWSVQRYAKILPITEVERKTFVLWATDKFNIYSLGRFATWRPGLLMDDVVNDVRVIRRIINNGSYDHRKK
tara:strand:- start:266 stop:1219 length:954 start_codon:yes stop_codon:yes gene_type:complete